MDLNAFYLNCASNHIRTYDDRLVYNMARIKLSRQNTGNQHPRVLVVDDDRFFMRQMVDILDNGGFEVKGVASGAKALEQMRKADFEVVVTDVVMEDMTGIELLKAIRRRDRLTPVICVSGVRSFDNAVELIRAGAADFLTKPFEPRQLVAAVTGACIEHQYALEREQMLVRSDKWSRELLTLRQLGEVSSKEMLQILFERTIEAVSDILQIETASLMLLEGDELRVVEAVGLPGEIIGKATVPIGRGISGHVAGTGKPLLINDINRHEKFTPSSFRDQYSTQSALCVPLIRGERVLGVLNANNKKSGEAFTESDRDLLVTIAAQVAMSIDNARLFAGLEEKAEDLRQAHEELVRLDKDKTELILNMSHELKTPLTSIIGFASLIPSLELSGDTDALMGIVGHLESSASHLNYLVERILELFRLEAGRTTLKLEPHPVRVLVNAALQEFKNILDGRKVNCDLNGALDSALLVDGRLFTRTLQLILENAVKFSPRDKPIEIQAFKCDQIPEVPDYTGFLENELSQRSGNGWIRIIIRDHGMGIVEKDIPRIFEKFKQLGDIMTEKPSGLGLGLSIARAIVERHHGTIWADLASGGGSRFHLLLPMA
jgi:signal transduction histidine kinase/DNA-binding response OmpR family regulator